MQEIIIILWYNFDLFQTALEDLGVDEDERLDLLKLVAVVLKLGNLTFLPTTNMDGTEGCTIANDYGKQNSTLYL